MPDTEQPEFVISPTQGVQLMSLATLMKEGDIDFRGHEPGNEQSARELIADVAQELALQVRQ